MSDSTKASAEPGYVVRLQTLLETAGQYTQSTANAPVDLPQFAKDIAAALADAKQVRRADRVIPIDIQKANRPDSRRRQGEASAMMDVDELLAMVGIPKDYVVEVTVTVFGTKPRWLVITY